MHLLFVILRRSWSRIAMLHVRGFAILSPRDAPS